MDIIRTGDFRIVRFCACRILHRNDHCAQICCLLQN